MPDRKTGRVSPCGRFHVDPTGAPLYSCRFDEALAFHDDGMGGLVAAVRRDGEAWHIRPDGSPAHAARFQRCFGFYEGRAAVIDPAGWHHVDPAGCPISDGRYRFAGNFREGLAVVCDVGERYFHVDRRGAAAYPARWRYCGDFSEDAAVVQRDDGLHSHIDPGGRVVHGLWFEDLDVFHKGFARAQDPTGWHHVDRAGRPVYSARFASIEPFYNGCARVERFDGSKAVIDESGRSLRELRPPRRAGPAAASAGSGAAP